MNDVKSWYRIRANGVRDTEPSYNKLTIVLLSLGLVTVADLSGVDDLELDVETLIGKKFEFKLVPQWDKPALSDIDIDTIRFAKNQ